jgi:hypothetical protein
VQVDGLAREPPLLAGVGVVRDHEVPVGQRRRHVDLRGRRGLERAVDRLARAQQRLGRDAGVVGALPADQRPFDHGDVEAAVGQCAGAVLAGRAGADDDDVVVSHGPPLVHVGHGQDDDFELHVHGACSFG